MNRHLATAATLLLVGLSPWSANAEDWPTYLKNNQRQGYTGETLKLPLHRVWEFESAAPPVKAWGGPGERIIEGKDLEPRVSFDDAFHAVAVGGRVYFGSSVDHQLRCVDAATGTEQWHFFTGGPIRLAPTVADGRVYFGSDDGYVYCLNAESGRVVWQRRAGPADEWLIARGEMISRWPVRTGVLVDGDTAWFGAGIFPHENVYLYAVKAATGEVIWDRANLSQSDAGRNDLSPQGYLLCSDDKLFVPSGRSLPGVLDRNTGRFAFKPTINWRRDGVTGGTQAMLADGQMYAWGAHQILAMDQSNGKVGFGWFNGDQMAIDGDAAYISDGTMLARVDRKEYAVNSRKRHKLEAELATLTSRLRGEKGDAAEKTKSRLKAVQDELTRIAQVGFAWKQPSPHESALTVTGQHVLTGGHKKIVAHDSAAGQPVWTADVAGTVRGIAVSDGRVLVSTDAGRVICFASDAGKVQAATTGQDDAAFAADEQSAQYEKAAREILSVSGTSEGFCLVVGSERGRLAYELAKRSKLKIYCVDPSAENVRISRERFRDAGLYGNRVTVHHAELTELPYSNYFADLVVSETQLLTGTPPISAEDISRHVKPLGGTVLLASRSSLGATSAKAGAQWLADLGLDDQSERRVQEDWLVLTRGGLPGAGNWSHQYGDAGNTACSADFRVKGGLGVLWYGDPGEDKMVNRHEGAVGPLAVNGRLFIQGESTIMGYDAYNGRFLWEVENPESIRTGVFQNHNPGNLVATDDALFYMVDDRCVQLDAATGQVVREHRLPAALDDDEHQWGYVAYHDGRLFGTATRRAELERRLRRRGRKTNDSTDVIFAIDVGSGDHLWTYQGKTIAHHTIAVGKRRVFFIDSSITSDERQRILDEDKSELQELTGQARQLAEERAKRADLRLAVAVDADTGEVAWSKPVDVTDCSQIGIGGGQLTLMFHNDVLVLCGANANGHYWKQFLAGDFSRRRLVALAAEDGRKLWARDANYRHRPIIVEDQVIAEPWAVDLYTGQQKMRPNPVTGDLEPWSIMRSGHHCGMISAAPNMLFFRAGYTGFYDLQSDDGTQHFAGHRTGCWINMIPANGLLMIPESSAGCVCLFSVASTIVMEPRESRRPWAIYSSTGSLTPVQHLSLNFGAPGDRRDAQGRVWLAYPRPRPSRATGLDLKLDLEAKLASGAYEAADSYATTIDGAEVQWVASSAARGLREFTIPVREATDSASRYSMRLHFAEPDDTVSAGERVFDVYVDGERALEAVDIAAAGEGRAMVREISARATDRRLKVELRPHAGSKPPVLSGFELIRVE